MELKLKNPIKTKEQIIKKGSQDEVKTKEVKTKMRTRYNGKAIIKGKAIMKEW